MKSEAAKPSVQLAAGAALLRGATHDDAAAEVYADVLHEPGTSAAAEIVQLENRTITLQGAVEAQYSALQGILKDLWLDTISALSSPGRKSQ